tara:strand:- start:465 stop:632 length:168 start_codon:yes stop_codon:yes gene_type:complete
MELLVLKFGFIKEKYSQKNLVKKGTKLKKCYNQLEQNLEKLIREEFMAMPLDVML